MPVLIRAMINRLPGKRDTDNPSPAGIPTHNPIRVATPVILTVIQAMLKISRSNETSMSTALTIPVHIISMGCSAFRAFSRTLQEGREKGRSILVPAELADKRLDGRTQQEIHQGFGAADVRFRESLGIDRDDMIDI